MTASDIAAQGGPAGRAARRRRHQHDHRLRARLPGRHQRLGPAAAARRGRGVRDHRARRQVRLRPTHRGRRGAPAAGGVASAEPARAEARGRPAALPRRRHVVRAGQGGRGPRLGHRHQAGPDLDRAGRRPRRSSLPEVDPAQLAKTFGDARYVADRRAAPHPGRGGHRGGGAGRGGRGHVRRVRGRRARAIRRSAPAPPSPWTVSAPPSTASTPSPRRATGSTPTTGYTTAFSVTGVQDRTHAGPGRRRRHRRATAPPGVVIAIVDDVNDPEKPGRVRLALPVAVGRLRERLGAHGAGRSRQGPRSAGPARGR